MREADKVNDFLIMRGGCPVHAKRPAPRLEPRLTLTSAKAVFVRFLALRASGEPMRARPVKP